MGTSKILLGHPGFGVHLQSKQLEKFFKDPIPRLSKSSSAALLPKTHPTTVTADKLDYYVQQLAFQAKLCMPSG